MSVHYSEFDPFAAEWLRNLIAAGELPQGTVDERDIREIRAAELVGCRQVHLFAGIGGWPLALRLAGWPEDAEVWTGSCPCQPFSAAGRRQAEADERHLWPEMRRLIAERKPATVFGEQVESADGRLWLAGVREDLEALGYRVGAADLCAAGASAPHIRQRLFWVADTGGQRAWRNSGTAFGEEAKGGSERLIDGQRCSNGDEPHGAVSRLAVAGSPSSRQHSGRSEPEAAAGGVEGVRSEQAATDSGRRGGAGGVAKTDEHGRSSQAGDRIHDEKHHPEPCRTDGGLAEVDVRQGQPLAFDPGPWGDFDILPFKDGQFRRVERGSFPLAPRIPVKLGQVLARLERLGVDSAGVKRARRNRNGRLKGYGNAIVPQVAALFVRAYMDVNLDRTDH